LASAKKLGRKWIGSIIREEIITFALHPPRKSIGGPTSRRRRPEPVVQRATNAEGTSPGNRKKSDASAKAGAKAGFPVLENVKKDFPGPMIKLPRGLLVICTDHRFYLCWAASGSIFLIAAIT